MTEFDESIPSMKENKSAVDQTSKLRKLEPQDKLSHNSERSQLYAAIAFAVTLIVLGLPLWWKTTEVYRVSLPYDRIEALGRLEVSFATEVRLATLDPARGLKLAADLQDIFKTSKLFDVRFTTTAMDKQLLAGARGLEDLEGAAGLHPSMPGTLLLLEVPGLARWTPTQVLLGTRRTVYFSSDTGAVRLSEVLDSWLLREASLLRTRDSMTSPTETDRDGEGRRRIPAARGHHLMVTVVNPEPEQLRLDWDLPRAINDYIQPLLTELAPLADHAVMSQWLYLVALEVQPKMVPASVHHGPHFALAEDILPHVITPLEKKLGSHVSSQPCLNLVLYVPPCYTTPLHIYTRQGVRPRGGVDAFLSPRWGGIVIHNPPAAACLNESAGPRTFEPDTAAVMGIFLEQLRLLLGIPHLEPILKADLLPLYGSSLRRWELDSLLRMRALEQLTSAKLTLQSLSQLLGEISNIVINDEVGASISLAVASVEEACQLLGAGRLVEAHAATRRAFLSAEEAFTDPSLLSLLYFPDDQKYAVYIPLFLPVMIPVIMSLRNIVSFLVSLRPGAKVKA